MAPQLFPALFLDILSNSIKRPLSQEDFYHLQEKEAVFHFFRVAASLDSMVLGETEIMKQIKDQSRACLKHKHMSRRLKALVDVALKTSGQVHQKTQITQNVVSMASLTYRKVMDRLANKPRRRVVFVGAGHFIKSILPTFSKSHDLELCFVNRNTPHELAATYGGSARSLEDFRAQPQPFDAMITATAAPEPLFDKIWAEKHAADVLIMDAALPRDVHPEVGQLPGVTCIDLREMETTLRQNREARRAEIPKTRPIFESGLEKLRLLWLECELAHFNRQISSHYRKTGDKALGHLIKERLPNLSEHEEEQLREWTRGLVKKLTNIPILGLKGVARDVGQPAVNAYTKSIGENSNLFKS